MVGLTRAAAYFPRRRLDRALLGQAWGGRASGTRTVAALDEDALTMATDAALACVGTADPAGFDGLYFASTSAPYLEKQIASVIATAVDLPRGAAVADFAGSVRAGASALRAALDAVAAGSLRHVLVAAADARAVEPGSELEAIVGDGAAAVAVGREGVIAELVGMGSVSEEFTHLWRTDQQRWLQVADLRFGATYGTVRDVAEAVGTALRRAEVPPTKLAKLVVAAPDARAAADAAKKIGCDPGAQLIAPLVAEAGVLGSPDPLVLLIRALETVRPGEFVAVAAYGEGADAFVFRATDALAAARPRPLADRLARGLPVPSYAAFLRMRGVLPYEIAGETVTPMVEWKELRQDLRLYGSRCEECGLVQYPQARVCIGCRSQDRTVEHRLVRRGTVFTFTLDHLAASLESPMAMVVVDLDGGGRVYLQSTDAAPGEVGVGTRVELTYRRLHEGGGNRNYFWKARPLAGGAA
jgi:3-hydroxy-3-methylglutaryl CoA synthase/uncharacterized OB-fold protein